uniref:Non-specific serine/threonine protein kinase n=1 Tax=Fagus sylvatica TaxID=28930 RepID=A0A2N9HP83_FAGSY
MVQRRSLKQESKKSWSHLALLLLIIMSLKTHVSTASDTMHPGQPLAWNQTLISKNGIFELGFFTPGKSHNYYVGIWYKRIAEKTVVWEANRDFPISDPSSSALKISKYGNLMLKYDGVSYIKFKTSGARMPNSTIGAKIGYNRLTNESKILTSWTGLENPVTKWFTAELVVEKMGKSHLVIYDRMYNFHRCDYGEKVFQKELNNQYINVSYVSNRNESYFIYSAVSPSTFPRFVLNVTGELNLYVWKEDLRQWNLVWKAPPLQYCGLNGFCGDFGICNQQRVPLCDCPKGFKPRYPADWDSYIYTEGSDNEFGGDLYIRISASELMGSKNKILRKVAWIVGVLVTLILSIGFAITWRRHSAVGALEEAELSLIMFKYRDLRRATKNFSQKLGEGSFGSVFKGILPNSTTIAVKKMRSLEQGEKQFHAEVSTLGAIQHVNLLLLRGFCVEASKRFLVYEYMPKGSLESHLFQNVSKILDWKKRYHIAIGTARGLAYLHDHCRDCIIHCDIKPENILLDAEYDPKVADFGLAKVIGEAITPKVDVFSYGKLLFEIVSGRRNISVLDDEICNYFPARVAIAMSKGEDLLTLLDHKLEGSANMEELTRACTAACWCIQDDPRDRPTMGQVVKILEGVMHVGIPQSTSLFPTTFRKSNGSHCFP